MRQLGVLACTLLLACRATFAQTPAQPLAVLPETAVQELRESLQASRRHVRHIWRDTPPMTEAGLVNAYVEIPRGERTKWEFDMAANAREVDRVIPEFIDAYPVNYGYVPQTVSYDGDPFDVLVLGPALPGGEIVQGAIVGLMYMEDEKGYDAKVVVSPVGKDGRPLYALTDEARGVIGEYFRTYKRNQPGKFSRVPGWGSAREAEEHLRATHKFFADASRVSRH